MIRKRARSNIVSLAGKSDHELRKLLRRIERLFSGCRGADDFCWLNTNANNIRKHLGLGVQ